MRPALARFGIIAALLAAAITLHSFPARASDKPTAPEKRPELWALKPIVRPDVPAGLTASCNPSV